MADIGDIAIGAIGTGTGSAFIIAFAKKWIDDREKERTEALAKVREAEEESKRRMESKLDAALAGVQRMETSMNSMTSKSDMQTGRIDGMEQRVSGISASHGPKLEDHEKRINRLEFITEKPKRGTK